MAKREPFRSNRRRFFGRIYRRGRPPPQARHQVASPPKGGDRTGAVKVRPARRRGAVATGTDGLGSQTVPSQDEGTQSNGPSSAHLTDGHSVHPIPETG